MAGYLYLYFLAGHQSTFGIPGLDISAVAQQNKSVWMLYMDFVQKSVLK